MSRFAIGEEDFLLDDEPFRILSGAIHYFRVHPGHWADRIRAARIMGLNTIETYVAWNEHAPVRGRFDLEGRLDLGAFLDAVHAEGMRAIVRPGPYICAEHDNGGLPAWLTALAGIGLRRSDPVYLAAAEEYLAQVAEIVRPRLIDAGGPVILLQVENEYGAFGKDAQYLRRIAGLYLELGLTVPFVTIDQPTEEMLSAGGLPEIHKTGSFGSRAAERLATLRRHQPTGPLMCGEFWDGWFDSWGTLHHTTSAAESAAELDALLAAGASVNIYMFHGGTNFGLSAGANHKGRYLPITTSYDYDAPLDEAGRPTEKYWAFRDVISAYAPVPDGTPPAPIPAPAFDVALAERAPLDALIDRSRAVAPEDDLRTFDDVGHARGLALYTAALTTRRAGVLSFGDVRDRAWVSVDGERVGVLSRDAHERSIRIPPVGERIDVLVEDQGRVNYGPRLGEPKGLIGPVHLDGERVPGWSVTPIDLDALVAADLPRTAEDGSGAVLARARFALDEPRDLFLDTSMWGKGFAWMNGFALGRYWRRGPQQTLFVPGPSTRSGENVLTVLELEVLTTPRARFVANPRLGPTEE